MDSLAHSDGIVLATTRAVDGADKVEFWADLVCRHLIAVECQSIKAPEHFYGEIRGRAFADFNISQVASAAQRVARTPGLMARDSQEYFLLNIQRSGNGMVEQGQREAWLAPGQMALYSSARPYRLSFDAAFHQTVLVLPAAGLRAILPGVDRLTATAFGAGHALAPLLMRTADQCFALPHETLAGEAARRVQNSLTEMLAAALSLLSPSQRVTSDLADYHLCRIKQYILDNISDPELSVANVAAALRLSVSHVHRLFKAEGVTCNAWLWSRRMARCRQALADPANRHFSVSRIAFQFGFNNASHFSRVFRVQFGVTPREWRDG